MEYLLLIAGVYFFFKQQQENGNNISLNADKAPAEEDNYLPGVDDSDIQDPNDEFDDLRVSGRMEVGNLVGKNVFRCRTYVTVYNNSKTATYVLSKIDTSAFVLGENIRFDKGLEAEMYAYLKPGQTYTYDYGVRIASVPMATLSGLREAFCSKAGKKLITSVPINTYTLTGIGSLDVQLGFLPKSGAGTQIEARYVQMPVNVKYISEAFYS